MTVYLLSGKDMYRQEERLATLLKEFSIGKDFVKKSSIPLKNLAK